MKILETNLHFGSLSPRSMTTAIVVHHSNGGRDVDFSAEQIHDIHVNGNRYSGIGYHYVIRKDGTIERGRPEDAVGAHAAGHNYYTVGICVSGDFELAEPTDAQIDSLVELIRDIADGYDIPLDRDHVLGHQELNSTDCPGKNLYARLDEVVARAANNLDVWTLLAGENFYRVNHSEHLIKIVDHLAVDVGARKAFDVLKEICRYPNLSYIDAPDFDRQLEDDILSWLTQNPPKG